VGGSPDTSSGAGNLDVGLARADQVDQNAEAGLLQPAGGERPAKVIEYHRHGRGQHQIANRRDEGGRRIDLDVPAARFHPLGSRLEPLPGHRRIRHPAGRQVEADASNPRAAISSSAAFRGTLVDHSHAPGAVAELAQGAEQAGIVRAIHARCTTIVRSTWSARCRACNSSSVADSGV